MKPSCRHCTHAEGRPGVDWRGAALWCLRHRTLVQRPCADFAREPGSDDEGAA
jgi:hypothetical protein